MNRSTMRVSVNHLITRCFEGTFFIFILSPSIRISSCVKCYFRPQMNYFDDLFLIPTLFKTSPSVRTPKICSCDLISFFKSFLCNKGFHLDGEKKYFSSMSKPEEHFLSFQCTFFFGLNDQFPSISAMQQRLK